MAEATDLRPVQCGFESHLPHMTKHIVRVSIMYGPYEEPPRLSLEYGPLRYKVIQWIGGTLCEITWHRFCNTRLLVFLESYGWQHVDNFEIPITTEQIAMFKEVAGWTIE